MGAEKTYFPESDAWAATMPDVRGAFASVKSRGSASIAPKTQADAEYQKFAKLDMSNVF